MDRITFRASISIAVAALIGFLLAYATEIGLAFSVAMPTLCFLQKRRIHALLVAFAYYGAASSILIPGAKSFFGPGTTLLVPVALWGTASLLLALPFAMLWINNPRTARWRAPLAVLASVPPPLGIIGWANPLTAAGLLFPGTGWFGLFAVLTFAAFSPLYHRSSGAALITSAILANAVFPGVPAAPPDWEAVSTTFRDLGPESSSMLSQFEVAQYIQQRALQSHARVILFPEAVVARWSEATDLFWAPTLSRLASSGKILLVGAGVDIAATTKYENIVIIRGAETGSYVQRIPVPIGMWQPFGDDGVPLSPFGATAISVTGRRISFLICYEQFLTWPVLGSVASQSNLLVGIANHHWLSGTYILNVQAKLLPVWARLFQIPWISAVNT